MNLDQPVPRPIRMMLGPEVFASKTPMGINMEHLIAFQRRISPSGMFRFDYVAFQKKDDLSKRLQDAGIALTPLIYPQPRNVSSAELEAMMTEVRELAFQCDLVVPTEVLQRLEITIPNSRQFVGSPACFVRALDVQTQISVGWDVQRFREYAQLTDYPHREGAKAYRKTV